MIAHIVLNVSDFSRSEEFYDRLLIRMGYSQNYREESADYAVKSYQHGKHKLWIKCERMAEHLPFVRDTGLDHLAFKASSKSEVDDIHGVLRKAGVTLTRPPTAYPEYSPKYYAFYFRDPDGIPLEVAYY